MSMSGSFNTSSVPRDYLSPEQYYYGWTYFTCNWSATNDMLNNTSTISFNFYTSNDHMQSQHVNCSLYVSVTSGGRSYYNGYVKAWGTQLYQNTWVAGFSVTIPHDDYGNASFSISMTGRIWVNSNGMQCSGSRTPTLDKIDRGLARIYDGSTWKTCMAYVYNGSSWKHVMPEVYNGSTWKLGV